MSNFVPLSDLPSFEAGERGPVTWDFNLPPGVDTERISLNVGKLERIARIGAFASMHIASYDGEVTTATPGIGGFNNDGTAVATKAVAVTAAERYKTDTHDQFEERFMREFGVSCAVLNLNKSEMVPKVVDRRQSKDISREEAWAAELRSSLHGAIRSAAKSHLLQRNEGILKAIAASAAGYNAVRIGAAIQDNNPELATAATSSLFAVNLAVATLLASRPDFRRQGGTLFDKRWSFFPYGMQPDRYAMLCGATALGRTFKVAS